jgi:hypothetical protein
VDATIAKELRCTGNVQTADNSAAVHDCKFSPGTFEQ